jgi:hypothetical protein
VTLILYQIFTYSDELDLKIQEALKKPTTKSKIYVLFSAVPQLLATAANRQQWSDRQRLLLIDSNSANSGNCCPYGQQRRKQQGGPPKFIYL